MSGFDKNVTRFKPISWNSFSDVNTSSWSGWLIVSLCSNHISRSSGLGFTCCGPPVESSLSEPSWDGYHWARSTDAQTCVALFATTSHSTWSARLNATSGTEFQLVSHESSGMLFVNTCLWRSCYLGKSCHVQGKHFLFVQRGLNPLCIHSLSKGRDGFTCLWLI